MACSSKQTLLDNLEDKKIIDSRLTIINSAYKEILEEQEKVARNTYNVVTDEVMYTTEKVDKALKLKLNDKFFSAVDDKLDEKEVPVAPGTQLELFSFSKKQKADPELDKELKEKIMNFLSAIGASYQNVDSISGGATGKMTVVEQAGLLKKIIQVVEGEARIDVLPEEAVHLLIELLDKDSVLYKGMYNQIDKFQIYQDVKKQYSEKYNNDETMLRREAMGKLVAQYILNKNYQPQEAKQAERVDNWFKQVVNAIRRLFIKNKTEVGYFKDAAAKLLKSDLSNLSDSNLKEVEFFNLTDKQAATKKKLLEEAAKVVKKGETYFYEGKQTKRVSDIIEAKFKNKYKKERTPEEKLVDGYKAKVGTQVHDDVNNILKRREDGSTPKVVHTSEAVYQRLEKYINKFINELPAGSVIMSEITVHNPKKNITGTIDLLVIDKEGVAHIFDWKTRQFSKAEKESYKSVAEHKRESWAEQLSQYRSILREGYNIKEFGKTRMIPISIELGKQNGNPVPELAAIKFGDTKGETIPANKYLNPVPAADESTGSKPLNKLISQLQKVYEDISKRESNDPGVRAVNRERLHLILQAIRGIQVNTDLEEFINYAGYEISKITAQKTFTENEIAEYRELMKLILDLDQNLTKLYKDATINKTTIASLSSLRVDALSLEDTLRDKMMSSLEVHREGTGVESYDKLTRELSFWERNFSGANLLNNPVFKVFWKLVSNSKEKTRIATKKLSDEIGEKIKNLKGKGFDKLVNKSTGNLINKYSKEFYTEINKLIKEEKWETLKGMVEINTVALNEFLERRRKEIKEKSFHVVSAYDAAEKSSRLKALNEDFDIEHHPAAIANLINRGYFIKKEPKDKLKWYSAEFKAIQSDKDLLEFYEFFTGKIKEYRKWLPVDISGNFIPNIRKDMLERSRDNFGGVFSLETLNGFVQNELGKSEGHFMGQVNEITGEYEKEIPIYFTNNIDNDAAKNAELKSYDLGKVLYMFGAMALNYKNMEEIEGGVKNLKSLLHESKEAIKTPDGKTKLSEVTGNILGKNTEGATIELFNDYVNHYLYGIRYKEDLGNITRESKDKEGNIVETQYSVNRFVDNSMQWYSKVALGFNLAAGAGAFFGGTFNTLFIAAKGRFFNKTQFTKSAGMIAAGLVPGSTAFPIIDYFDLHNADHTYKKANNLSIDNLGNKFSPDLLFAFLKGPDWAVSNSILLSLLQNHTIENGKIVSLNGKAAGTKSIMELVQMAEGKTNLATLLSDEQFSQIRTMTYALTEKALGMSSRNNINGFKLSIFGTAAMQFKSWIPMMFQERLAGINYEAELHSITKGRYITFFQTLLSRSVLPLIYETIKVGMGGITGENLKERISELYKMELAKDATLDPDVFTEEAYIQLYEENIKAMVAEITTITLIATSVLLANSGNDDKKDRANKAKKRILDKILNEFTFFIDPRSAYSIVSSGPFPVLGYLHNLAMVLEHTIGDVLGQTTGNKKLEKKYKPMHYVNKSFPVISEIEKNFEWSQSN